MSNPLGPGVDAKTKYRDPLQTRWVELNSQYRRIIAEKRRLKERMTFGNCEICGAEFRRTRVTKKHCSQACTVASYNARADASFNTAVIAEALPLLEAGQLLTPRALAIVNKALRRTGPFTEVAEEMGISRQRVQQVMASAFRLSKMALAMKAAVNAEAVGQ